LIDEGKYSNVHELARAIGKDDAYVSRIIRFTLLAPDIIHAVLAGKKNKSIRLTLLAPEIIHAILHGTLKKSISMETLRKSWPENWEEQKKYFGLI